MIVAVSLNSSLDRVYNVDDFALGGRFRVPHVTETAGGKALNVARIAHQLGAPVMAVGTLAGHTGARIEDLARLDGLRTSFVQVAGESRQCHTIVHGGKENTEILEAGPLVNTADLQALDTLLRDVLRPGYVVALSGSLPPGAPVDTYARLTETVREVGAYALVDASGETLQQAVRAVPYAIKPNEPELAQYVGRDLHIDDVPDVAAQLHKTGIAWVLVSLGAAGMIAAVGGALWRVRVPRIEAVSAVGSGDSFVGGWADVVARLADKGAPTEDDIVHALTKGSAAAVSNTMQLRTATCDVEQVAALAKEIVVEKL